MNHMKWDAAVNHPTNSNKVYFFLGDQYYRYDWSTKAMDAGYPKPINKYWQGVPSDIDGALNHPTDNSKVYFFKADANYCLYYCYNWQTSKVDDHYPQAIGGIWGGIQGNISAAVNHPTNNTKIYIFKGTIYYRLTWKDFLTIDSGYPKSIGTTYFPNIPWHIEAAVNHPDLANKVYFFKQNQCYLYDWSTRLEAEYPKLSNQDWPGLPLLTAPEIIAGPLCSSVTKSSASIWLWCGQSFNSDKYTVKLNDQFHTFTREEISNNGDTISTNLVNKAIGNIVPGSEIANLNFEGLSVATIYNCALYKDNIQVASLTFKTAPAEFSSTGFKLLLGSCSDSTVNSDVPNYMAMAAENPDLVLMAGDNSYYYDAEEKTTSKSSASTSLSHDWSSVELMLRRQLKARQQKDFISLMQKSLMLSIWDDHDFGYNNAKGAAPLGPWEGREIATNVYRAMWNNPYLPVNAPGSSEYNPAEPTRRGNYYDIQYGPAHIFMTDARYYKNGSGGNAELLGSDQLDWLCNGLASSSSPLKIIVFAGRVLRALPGASTPRTTSTAQEGFIVEANQEYSQLTNTLNSQVTGRVLILSGDIHVSDCYSMVDKSTSNKVVEVTSSPLRVNSKHTVSAPTANPSNQRLFSTDVESFTSFDITAIANSAYDSALPFNEQTNNPFLMGSQIIIRALDKKGNVLPSKTVNTQKCLIKWNLVSGMLEELQKS